MIKINLLPFRAARKRENVRRQVHVYSLCLLFLILVMVYFNVDLNGKLGHLESSKKHLQQELKPYAKTIIEIERFKKDTQLLNKKLEVIRNLDKQRVGPVQLLAEIARAVPLDRLWLESLLESKGVLTMQGAAMDNDTVALFMTELEKAPRIQSVDLGKTTLRSFPNYKLRAAGFELTCRLASATPEPKEKPKKKPNESQGRR